MYLVIHTALLKQPFNEAWFKCKSFDIAKSYYVESDLKRFEPAPFKRLSESEQNCGKNLIYNRLQCVADKDILMLRCHQIETREIIKSRYKAAECKRSM